jgi:NADH-quinone oxidoreductase subunit H
MSLLTSLARILLFPGLLFAVPAAWLVLWLERKSVALMQQRIGPPFGQPFFDFIKLLGKSTPPRVGMDGALMRAWPLIAVSASAGAVGLLPVLPFRAGFQGDLVFLLALMEIPAVCLIVAGFNSRSLFGEIGSAREAVLLVSYNLVFLLAAISIAVKQGSFRLDAIANAPPNLGRYIGLLGILLCLPAKLHVNPFSLPNAEQEIYAGPMTEYAGFELALWQLSHGLEWIASVGLVAVLAVPPSTHAWITIAGSLLLGLIVVLVLSFVAAATARLAIDTTVRFYGQCAVVLAVIVISSSLILRLWS